MKFKQAIIAIALILILGGCCAASMYQQENFKFALLPQGNALSTGFNVYTPALQQPSPTNSTRMQIYQFITSNPGVQFRAISAGLAIPVGLTQYHLGVLVKSGLVSFVRDGKYKRFFVSKKFTKKQIQTIAPLLVFRSLQSKPSIKLKRPKITYSINALLIVNLIVSAWALTNSATTIFIGTFVMALALLVGQAVSEKHKTWFTWIAVGVLGASAVSGAFGVGALVLFGSVPVEAFSTVFFGWVFGDIIVLATLGTMLTVVFTPYIVKANLYVKRYFS